MDFLCFVDLDGVLVDFVGGVLRFYGRTLEYPEIRWDLHMQLGLTVGDFWALLGEEFWAGLDPTPEMGRLMLEVENRFGRNNVFLCSSPPLTPGSATGKVRWVEHHLLDYARRLILTGRKEILAGPGRVLIDDHDVNCRRWEEVGGLACVVPRPWNGMCHLADDPLGAVKARLERTGTL